MSTLKNSNSHSVYATTGNTKKWEDERFRYCGNYDSDLIDRWQADCDGIRPAVSIFKTKHTTELEWDYITLGHDAAVIVRRKSPKIDAYLIELLQSYGVTPKLARLGVFKCCCCLPHPEVAEELATKISCYLQQVIEGKELTHG